MILQNFVERNRITRYWKTSKPVLSRPISSKSAPSNIPSPQSDIFKPAVFKPASPEPSSAERDLWNHEQHHLEDPKTKVSSLKAVISLAGGKKRRAKARVKSARELIQQLYDGQYEGKRLLIKRELTGAEYDQLLDEIAADPSLREYFNDKLRSDYTRNRKEFILRMPSTLHDTLAEEIGRNIYKQLEQIIERKVSGVSSAAAAAAKGIKGKGTSEIKFLVPKGRSPDKKGPDKAFQHRECKFPGVVIEVAWSQRKMELPSLAKQYIQKSKGSIRAVVGLNLNDIYKTGIWKGTAPTSNEAPATFSIWRAEVDRSNGRQEVRVTKSEDEKEFRDRHGDSVSSADLRLYLTDFVCEKVARSFENGENPEIVISSASLCEHYEEALSFYRMENLEEAQDDITEAQEDMEEAQGDMGGAQEDLGGAQGDLENGSETIEGAVPSHIEPRRSARLMGKPRATEPHKWRN
ncbi:hypothetical protein K469DRAFT_654861 [Zopfia rhizophila CBS 207.26]|uniref:Uncharacterized protein n=1 Tax=Zopfia rhizophila CBS 207.26 TaxID=1314779 RepID=A0A6A6ELU4_9PEZI|nr:hypothetical protein K469DRAFT_654861 [Zopfia rhizophila CBS 207.26]